MKTFTDNAGRTWVVQINVFAIKRLRGLLNVDLYGLVDNEFAGLGKLLSDPVQLVDVLYCLCKDEADKRGITDEDFGRSMGGDSIELASNAFLEEFVDFFPDPRVRAGLTKVLTASRKLRDNLLTQALENLDEIDVESLARKSKNLSGNSRERWESTQEALPSEN